MDDDMAAVKISKLELRKKIQTKLKQLTREVVLQQSQMIQKKLLSMPEYQRAKNISIYLSMPDGEVSTRSIVEDALHQGKKVFVPYLNKEQLPGNSKPTSVMDMVSLHSEADYDALRVDKWGIPTPDEASLHRRTRVLGDQGKAHVNSGNESRHLDIMVMPGVAFDHQLRRLGHGKGFYDFFLHRYQQSIEIKSTDGSPNEQIGMPYLVGLALQEQLLPDGEVIPTTISDWQLNALIIGNGSLLQGPNLVNPAAR